MRKRAVLCMMLALVLMTTAAWGEAAQRRVYRSNETEPFGAEEETFDLYVCPLLGADCMVLLSEGETMLVDMGKNTSYDAITDVLNTLGITHFDIAFNSHPHSDHLGAMRELIKTYPVGMFMTAYPDDYKGKSIVQMSTLGDIRRANIPVERVEDGTTFSFGIAKMTVVRQTRFKDCNLNSAMLMIECGECKMLLGADVTDHAQKELAATHDLKADILKFPHHGQAPAMLEFLEEIAPEYAVITHGYKNTKAVQKQLDRYGIDYDFATWGVIHLSCNGQRWIVDQWLTEDGKSWTQKYRPDR